MESLPNYLLAFGFVLLIGEVLLGFSTILLLTLGLSTIIVSAAMFMGLLESDLFSAFIATAILDAVLMALLWGPMKGLQKDKAPTKVKSDLIGNTFDLDIEVGPGQDASMKYSGVLWKIKSAERIPKGERVEIIDAEVGCLHVKRAN
jgi:membrane protein implicated in regulation of membrane protease activity